MKSFLTLILLFCCHFIFAQNIEHTPENKLKQDSVNLQNKVAEIMMVNIDEEKNNSNLNNQKTSLDRKSSKEKSEVAQNINIVQEINTVLNYKINRIWREDLYCLVCQKNYSPRLAA